MHLSKHQITRSSKPPRSIRHREEKNAKLNPIVSFSKHETQIELNFYSWFNQLTSSLLEKKAPWRKKRKYENVFEKHK